jgi:hypothetical protein
MTERLPQNQQKSKFKLKRRAEKEKRKKKVGGQRSEDGKRKEKAEIKTPRTPRYLTGENRGKRDHGTMAERGNLMQPKLLSVDFGRR